MAYVYWGLHCFKSISWLGRFYAKARLVVAHPRISLITMQKEMFNFHVYTYNQRKWPFAKMIYCSTSACTIFLREWDRSKETELERAGFWAGWPGHSWSERAQPVLASNRGNNNWQRIVNILLSPLTAEGREVSSLKCSLFRQQQQQRIGLLIGEEEREAQLCANDQDDSPVAAEISLGWLSGLRKQCIQANSNTSFKPQKKLGWKVCFHYLAHDRKWWKNFRQPLVFLPLPKLPNTRTTLAQLQRFKIRRMAFLNNVKFADILILRIQSGEKSAGPDRCFVLKYQKV